MTEQLFVDIIGWIGSILVVLAYFLISAEKLTATSMLYQLCNAIGSVGLIVNTVYYAAYPSTFINVVWLFIAIPAIVKIIRNKQKDPKNV